MFEKTKIHFCALLIGALILPTLALAQSEDDRDARDKYIYEKPSYAKLSQLYWALNKFDVEDDRNIDNFMLINECEIFRNYASDPFEWNDIRESGRKYIVSNVNEFSTRFEIEQPLRLSEYDLNQQTFEIWDPYKIDGMKLFEVLSPEFKETVCGVSGNHVINGYPRGVVIELPRPVSLLSIKMSPEVAKGFISMKDGAGVNYKFIDDKYNARDAYLVMKVEFFSVKDDYRDGEDGRMRAQALAALESIEIYADRKRKFLLYSKVFRQRSGRTTAEDVMRARFKIRKAKRDAEKAAEAAKEAAAKAEKEAAAAK